jgi:hypothetical protein
MDAELKAKWVKALRSGEFLQGKTFLESGGRYCCLGVLCRVQGATFAEPEFGGGSDRLMTAFLPERFGGNLGGRSEALADMNDSGSSFAEIADYIEREL